MTRVFGNLSLNHDDDDDDDDNGLPHVDVTGTGSHHIKVMCALCA